MLNHQMTCVWALSWSASMVTWLQKQLFAMFLEIQRLVRTLDESFHLVQNISPVVFLSFLLFYGHFFFPSYFICCCFLLLEIFIDGSSNRRYACNVLWILHKYLVCEHCWPENQCLWATSRRVSTSSCAPMVSLGYEQALLSTSLA